MRPLHEIGLITTWHFRNPIEVLHKIYPKPFFVERDKQLWDRVLDETSHDCKFFFAEKFHRNPLAMSSINGTWNNSSWQKVLRMGLPIPPIWLIVLQLSQFHVILAWQQKNNSGNSGSSRAFFFPVRKLFTALNIHTCISIDIGIVCCFYCLIFQLALLYAQ